MHSLFPVSRETSGEGPKVLIFRERRVYRTVRRLTDVMLASTALALTAPLLLAAMAAIVLDDGFPVAYAQRRVGRFGRSFTMYKLRTMRRESCAATAAPSAPGDRRVTRTGRILRRYSIDELPQLVNVLRGEMSLVGPRPEMPFVVDGYARWQHLRHLAPPGITCIWQTTHRKTVPLHRAEATALDLDYIEHASFWLDIALLVRTARAVLLAKGAY